MFEKFNWGHGITIFYLFFVAAVVSVLIASFSVDHSLVVDDYYAEDLAYQDRYEKMKNSTGQKKVLFKKDKGTDELTIGFTHEGSIKGSVQFYRPSDKSKDFTQELNERNTSFALDDLMPGKWILKVDWVEEGKEYYVEETIYL